MAGQRRLRLVPTWANTQPAFGAYLTEPGRDTAHPTGILVLTLSGHQIRTITRFIDHELPLLFGLADAHWHDWQHTHSSRLTQHDTQVIATARRTR